MCQHIVPCMRDPERGRKIGTGKGGLIMSTTQMPPLGRRALTVAALALSMLLCAAAGQLNQRPEGATREQRLSYISSLGWETEGEERQEEVSLPQRFTGVYVDYLELQRRAGFDLTPYAGRTLTRCSWRVSNYPGTEDVVLLDLLVCDGHIVGGDLRSTALDGFMVPLAGG